MGNYFDEQHRKIIRANNLLQFIHQVTINYSFRKSFAQEGFKSNLKFRKTNLDIYYFEKNLQGFPLQSEMREKSSGESKFGIKPYQSFSAIITIKQTYFLTKF